MAKFTQSDVKAHVQNVLCHTNRQRRRRAAMQFTRELLEGRCTDATYTMGEVLKLWNKVRFPYAKKRAK